MTTSQWLTLAYSPCLFIALGLFAYIGIKYSQGKEVARKTQLRLLGVAAVFLAVGGVLLVAGTLA